MAVYVFASPHQDDETLSMGASIRLHVEAGHDVHVLLMTNGINSAVRAATGLDRPQFAAARDDEMVRACRQLGVPFENVHISRNAAEDVDLSVQDAEDVLRGFLNEHPGAGVKTYSHLPLPSRHPDHMNAGQAALNLRVDGVITDLRMYVEPWRRDEFAAAHPGSAPFAEYAGTPDAVFAACDEYQVIDVAGGKYGIGYQSVGYAFDLLRSDPASWCHVPPAA